VRRLMHKNRVVRKPKRLAGRLRPAVCERVTGAVQISKIENKHYLLIQNRASLGDNDYKLVSGDGQRRS
jgi:hypothetical protein